MPQALRVFRRSELEDVSAGCLFRFNKIWNEGAPDQSDLSLVGIAGHAISHLYLHKLVEAHQTQDAELADQSFVEGIATSLTPSRLVPEVKHVWQFFAERFELPLERFVASEERTQTGQVGWAADLVMANPERNELEIVDWKWGFSPPMTEDALRMLFQARVYSRAAMDRFPGFHQYRFTLHAVRWGKVVSVVFSQSDLDSVETELSAAIATIQHAEATNDWPAVPGPACAYCQLECPVVSDQRNHPIRLTTREQAELVAGWLLPTSAAVSAGKKALKAYVSTNGPVNVNGIVWDNYPTEIRTYPLPRVMDAFTARNIGGFEDLTLSHSALSKAFKQFPKLEEDLRPVVNSKTSYRFLARKPGGPEVGGDE